MRSGGPLVPPTSDRFSKQPTPVSRPAKGERSSAAKVYSSHLTSWRRQRDRGELGTQKRGKLDQAETIIEVQKKLCTLFGLPVAETPTADKP